MSCTEKKINNQSSLDIQLFINLKAFCELVATSSGASAQVELLIKVLEKIANITKKAIESKIINTLNKTRNWTKRVQLTHAT